ncbi:hypothetical protein ANCCEY_11476 [Ancylostoma ceylanicum]|uniref:Zinc knuckle n=1 Tax=Ancylostoma ceylanicum TaxID=53326 RepID=A0A0D6LE14_9BILA|nr:hypothetical protein ANCCEY_11476 [Ancylostoma ceylanicum]
MDAGTLRAILDAKATQQQKALDAQAMQQWKTLDAVMERMERLFSAMGATPAAAPASSAEFVTNSLSTRLSEFTYDPDNGCTFNVWLLALLSTTPRKLAYRLEVGCRHVHSLNEPHPAEEDIRRLPGLNREDFSDVTPEQMKCLVWICGLANPEDADIRARALCKMEDNPQTTLEELSAEIQQFMDIRQDAKLLENQSSSPLSGINVVNAKKNQSRNPPSLCFRCGGPHWAKDCDFANKTCHDCERVGHKKGYCKNFTKKKPIPKQERRSANNVVTVASTTAHVTPGQGRCVKSKAHLTLKPDAKPVFQKARPIPYAALPCISQEIDRLVAADVLSPIDHSDWAAPIVVVQKKNGSIRLCADYSTGLSDALEQHHHPLPT